MNIAIHLPACFNEKGARENNEDSIYPFPRTVTTDDRLFLVCDGVGGENRGEVASALACYSVSSYFSSNPQKNITQEYLQHALDHTRLAFEKMESENPDAIGMATTMTLLYLSDEGVTLAHLGDSRIYHVRNGKIISSTRDHKWVNELVASGMLTEEQAKEHPKKNMITRVISASRNDQPEFRLVSDILPDDYFFLCTDGVLEQVYDELLEYHLRENPDNEASLTSISAAIKTECEGRTNDNFSAYLIRIKSIDLDNKTSQP